MNNRYNLLSLDPMYSPLHEKVAEIIAKKKYAVTSCLSKKIYLPTFKLYSAASIIRSNRQSIDNELLKKIGSLSSYHHSYVKKRENRELSSDELVYMASFYLGLKTFIIDNEIELVIFHNDTRWYHAIALLICKELGLPYLVTEQGLIRPYTTIIDNEGVNATANAGLLNKKTNSVNEGFFQPKNTHDSAISMVFFFLFLISFHLEKVFMRQNLLSYMHNDYAFSKYGKLFFKRLIGPQKKHSVSISTKNKYALLLLQLELDSQFLMYSAFNSNQELISKVQKKCLEVGMPLAIKKHPLDLSEYRLDEGSFFVDGELDVLINGAEFVVTINSSAILKVIETRVPLYILGDSMYDLKKYGIESIGSEQEQNVNGRKEYLKKLKENYLMQGAGYDYSSVLLKEKLEQLLSE